MGRDRRHGWPGCQNRFEPFPPTIALIIIIALVILLRSGNNNEPLGSYTRCPRDKPTELTARRALC